MGLSSEIAQGIPACLMLENSQKERFLLLPSVTLPGRPESKVRRLNIAPVDWEVVCVCQGLVDVLARFFADGERTDVSAPSPGYRFAASVGCSLPSLAYRFFPSRLDFVNA